WRPPGASTAIRPLRVVGWLAPIATLVNLLKKHAQASSFGAILARVSHTGFLELVSSGALSKRENSRRNVAQFSRDSGAWYRAVCLARGPMSGIGSPVSLCPFGARGFKSHSRRHSDFHTESAKEFFCFSIPPGGGREIVSRKEKDKIWQGRFWSWRMKKGKKSAVKAGSARETRAHTFFFLRRAC